MTPDFKATKAYISTIKGCRFIRKRYGLRAYLRAILTVLNGKRVNVFAYESRYYERKIRRN